MMMRRAETDQQVSTAWYSPCEAYRYGLRRVWAPDRPSVLMIMLNPSTATEAANDATIARCQRRAQRLGFGTLLIANLFAFRATRPQDLKRAADPVGPQNDALLQDWAGTADLTLAAWGVHGAHLGRGAAIAGRLTGPVCHLGLTRDGHPRHPLYLCYETPPQPWPMEDRYAHVPT